MPASPKKNVKKTARAKTEPQAKAAAKKTTADPSITAEKDKKLFKNPGEIFNLIKYLEAEKVDEFEYSEGDFSIRIKHGRRDEANGAATLLEKESLLRSLLGSHGAGPEAAHGENAAPAAETQVAAPAPPAEDESRYKFIESPITGSFYRAPSPASPPYVTPNQHVSKGQVVCIVEAMKLMNEIKSEHDGTVHKICVENGTLVNAKQKLFYIIPD